MKTAVFWVVTAFYEATRRDIPEDSHLQCVVLSMGYRASFPGGKSCWNVNLTSTPPPAHADKNVTFVTLEKKEC
jgi:hypothetical protein